MKLSKIIIGATTMVSAAVVASGVSIPLATTNKQSSNVDVNNPDNSGASNPSTSDPGATTPGTTDPGTTDPGTSTTPGTTDPGTSDPGTSTTPGTTDPGTSTTPGTTDPGTTDPGTTTPTTPKVISTIPVAAIDTFYFTPTSTVSDTSTLNTAISALFKSDSDFQKDYSESGSQTSYLDGFDNYKNVVLSYIDNSAVFTTSANSSFKMLATPITGSAWEDGTSDPKTITVKVIISNLASTITTDTFSYPIAITNVDDFNNDSLLNTELSKLFSSSSNILESFKNYLTYSSYKNVVLSYVNGSASFTDKTFQFSVVPSVNSMWSDRTASAKTITASISNLTYTDTLKDASISGTTATYSDVITGVTDNNSLIEYLRKNFSIDKLTGIVAKNVTVMLNEATVNYENGLTFEAIATPTNHHTWADGTTTPKVITVSYTCNLRFATVPTMWSMDSVLFKQNLIYAYWRDVNTGNCDMNAVGSAAVYDMSLYSYKNITYVNQSASKPRTVNMNQGLVTLFTVNVIPASGYTWDDGTTDPKSIDINIYTCSYSQVGTVYKQSGLITGLSLHWISNFTFSTGDFTAETFDENREIIKAKILADLQQSFASATDYTVSILIDPYSVGGDGYNYNDVFCYKIIFKDRETKENVSVVQGYTFTMSPTDYATLYS